MSLKPCNQCKEKSVKVKIYTRKDGVCKRFEFCINKGCGYKYDLPFVEEVLNVI